MNEEKKSVSEDQNIEETSQTRDPGRDRGPTKPTPEPLENPGKVDRGKTKPTPEPLENQGKVDRGKTSDENIQPDSPGKGDRGSS
ncbi:hypothetical protein VB834_01060 [Limnoraphis robusta Tam1]|uniref:Uncharacterized protein n=1 Tax=Limnoraphis robusta CS-951 TaxID=1637645 RepID=A0A0F5YII6_9CYAN|nr:hypothetical protein [Limnoraphis robusta]KKD38724.1 hypothetical protein WN50_07335 [Limnoraphis robusta CS-951]MEA5537614.1 hypothetical protein [Limnoraphis robusta Tam1]